MGITSRIVNKYGDVLMKYGICVNDKYTDKIDAWSAESGLARAKLLQKICEKYLSEHDKYDL